VSILCDFQHLRNGEAGKTNGDTQRLGREQEMIGAESYYDFGACADIQFCSREN
jgi:hypothetical protein